MNANDFWGVGALLRLTDYPISGFVSLRRFRDSSQCGFPALKRATADAVLSWTCRGGILNPISAFRSFHDTEEASIDRVELLQAQSRAVE